MSSTIILIGPICAGKSTVAEEISTQTGIPQRPMDDQRFDYYKEIGFSIEKQNEIRKNDGYMAMYAYWKPFEAHAVKRILEDYPNGIHDFGAGHSVYEDQSLFTNVKNILNDYENVFLLLPSPNERESINVLNKRLKDVTTNNDVYKLNEHFVKNKSNRLLAKYIVYTNGSSPEEVADKIIETSYIKW
ncbi:shikimate kinase [Virgibacillus sp. NKC19-3]|uniref:shikimate kinase n=1 Tax=Virgibacillus saliphilus TaxID=2831674 RepID=UPI001C9B9B35|nr:shikimate kinase [Virgibacillus sp. NKC19-3]MBY7144790.1 shikimate kinase [Virgibacillus sp. NKC19-3]